MNLNYGTRRTRLSLPSIVRAEFQSCTPLQRTRGQPLLGSLSALRNGALLVLARPMAVPNDTGVGHGTYRMPPRLDTVWESTPYKVPAHGRQSCLPLGFRNVKGHTPQPWPKARLVVRHLIVSSLERLGGVEWGTLEHESVSVLYIEVIL